MPVKEDQHNLFDGIDVSFILYLFLFKPSSSCAVHTNVGVTPDFDLLSQNFIEGTG